MNSARLGWRGRSDAPGKTHELQAPPVTNQGFTERGEYDFVKPGEGWSLRIDDEPLGESLGDPQSWRWTPGFYAGEVTAELVGPSPADRILFLLDVAPDTTKLGRDAFERMVQDLWAEDPALLLGSEPATARIGELGNSQDPWLAFSRLRRYGPTFLKAAERLRARPRRARLAHRASVPLHMARRVDRYTAIGVARSSAAALLLDSKEASPEFRPDLRLDVPVTQETLDSPANRTVTALLRAILSRVTAIRETLEAKVKKEQPSETKTPLAARWPVRRQALDHLEASLRTLSRRSPFRDVRRAEISAAGLTAVAADPAYAHAWGHGWRALRHGIEAGQTLERLWVSPTWEIYERWCFVRLGRLLQSDMPAWTWRRESERWVGTKDGNHAQLWLQPTFPSRAQGGSGRWSVSRERVPDLMLTVESRTGTRFLLLDAKYRSSRANVLDAMASAHIYQDSLRIGTVRPEASLLLVPSGGGAPWLEQADFHAIHGVGVHVFSPDSELVLSRAVRAVLEE